MPDMQLGSDGVLRVDYGYNPVLTTAGFVHILDEREKIVSAPVPVLVKMSGRPKVQVNQTGIMHTSRYLSLTTAVAYVTKEWYIKHLIDKHITLNKPPLPIFVFETDQEAINWLKRYLPTTESFKSGFSCL
ncbi:DUF7793 family protein [Leeia oryzae]|uniref:DUF7793 family protein n=1 Tax=Leeia oryzae TaxID=356662 RepID=UPI0003677BCE|nr:hypothetical protein [Leeia oryzae]